MLVNIHCLYCHTAPYLGAMLFLVLTLTLSVVGGLELYVSSNTGNDSNDGLTKSTSNIVSNTWIFQYLPGDYI